MPDSPAPCMDANDPIYFPYWPPLPDWSSVPRGRSPSPQQDYPSLGRRDSSASSVRSLIDDRLRMANEERGRSGATTPVELASPFRNGSPFEAEYAHSRRASASDEAGLHDYRWATLPLSSTQPEAKQTTAYFPGSRVPEALTNMSTCETCGRAFDPADQISGARRCMDCKANTVLSCRQRRICSQVERLLAERRYTCQYCTGYAARSMFALRAHLRRRHLMAGSVPTPRSCPYCTSQQEFKHRYAFICHMQDEHLCRRCGFYMSQPALALHVPEETASEISRSVEDGMSDAPLDRCSAEIPRWKSRTPTLSPPYMRPGPSQPSIPCYAAPYNAPRGETREAAQSSTDASAAPALSEQATSFRIRTPQTRATSVALLQTPAASPGDRRRGASLPPRTSRDQPLGTCGKRRASPLAERTYPCGVCGRTFRRRTLRDNHLRTHTDERPFACSHAGCEQTFKQKNEQSRHERTAHGGKGFVCGGMTEGGRKWGCGKAFARSDGLLEHQIKTKKGRRCLEQHDAG